MAYDVYTIQARKMTDNCDCESINQCQHNTWQADCPNCMSDAGAEFAFGPYYCTHCEAVFMGSIQSWTDRSGAPGED